MESKPACTIELNINALRMLYNIIKEAHEKYPPDKTDTPEMEMLTHMKSKLYACMMEYLFQER